MVQDSQQQPSSSTLPCLALPLRVQRLASAGCILKAYACFPHGDFSLAPLGCGLLMSTLSLPVPDILKLSSMSKLMGARIGTQACKPFVDPITKNKILFLDKSAASKKLMAEKFDLAQLEECLGGSLPASDAFNMQTYGSCMQVCTPSTSTFPAFICTNCPLLDRASKLDVDIQDYTDMHWYKMCQLLHLSYFDPNTGHNG